MDVILADKIKIMGIHDKFVVKCDNVIFNNSYQLLNFSNEVLHQLYDEYDLKPSEDTFLIKNCILDLKLIINQIIDKNGVTKNLKKFSFSINPVIFSNIDEALVSIEHALNLVLLLEAEEVEPENIDNLPF